MSGVEMRPSLSMRIITTEHTLEKPVNGLDVLTSTFRRTSCRRVPVIHLFGTTSQGERMCMHVHGVFPYLYVALEHDPDESYLQKLAQAIDKAINLSLGRPSSYTQHVFSISAVHGIPYYGFYHKTSVFLKIYIYNPLLINRLADLLLGGAVMGRSFQPHEAHIPYMLQFFIDYNLYGMNYINVSASLGRKQVDNPGADSDVLLSGESHGSRADTSQSSASAERQQFKVSVCKREVDVLSSDILNRLLIDDHVGANPGLLALWEDERKRLQSRGLEGEVSLEAPESQERSIDKNIGLDPGWYDRFISMVDALEITAEDDRQSFVLSSPGGGDRSSLNLSDTLLNSDDDNVDEQSISQVLSFNANLTQAAENMSCHELAALLANQSDSDEADEFISYSPKVSPVKGASVTEVDPLDRSLSYSPVLSQSPRPPDGSPNTSGDTTLKEAAVSLSGRSEERSMSVLSGGSLTSQSSRRSAQSLYKWKKKWSQESRNRSDTRSPTPLLSQSKLDQSHNTSLLSQSHTGHLSNLISQTAARSEVNTSLFSDDEDEEEWMQAICSDQLKSSRSGFDELYTDMDMKGAFGGSDFSSDEDLETTLMTQPVWEGAEQSNYDESETVPQVDGAGDSDDENNQGTFQVSNKANPMKLTFRKSISTCESPPQEQPTESPLKLKIKLGSESRYSRDTIPATDSGSANQDLSSAKQNASDKPKLTLSFKSLTMKMNQDSMKEERKKDKSERKKMKKEKSQKKDKHKEKKSKKDKDRHKERDKDHDNKTHKPLADPTQQPVNVPFTVQPPTQKPIIKPGPSYNAPTPITSHHHSGHVHSAELLNHPTNKAHTTDTTGTSGVSTINRHSSLRTRSVESSSEPVAEATTHTRLPIKKTTSMELTAHNPPESVEADALSPPTSCVPKLTFSKKGKHFTVSERKVSPLKLKIPSSHPSDTKVISPPLRGYHTALKSPSDRTPLSPLKSPAQKAELFSDLTLSSSDEESSRKLTEPIRPRIKISIKKPSKAKKTEDRKRSDPKPPSLKPQKINGKEFTEKAPQSDMEAHVSSKEFDTPEGSNLTETEKVIPKQAADDPYSFEGFDNRAVFPETTLISKSSKMSGSRRAGSKKERRPGIQSTLRRKVEKLVPNSLKRNSKKSSQNNPSSAIATTSDPPNLMQEMNNTTSISETPVTKPVVAMLQPPTIEKMKGNGISPTSGSSSPERSFLQLMQLQRVTPDRPERDSQPTGPTKANDTPDDIIPIARSLPENEEINQHPTHANTSCYPVFPEPIPAVSNPPVCQSGQALKTPELPPPEHPDKPVPFVKPFLFSEISPRKALSTDPGLPDGSDSEPSTPIQSRTVFPEQGAQLFSKSQWNRETEGFIGQSHIPMADVYKPATSEPSRNSTSGSIFSQPFTAGHTERPSLSQSWPNSKINKAEAVDYSLPNTPIDYSLKSQPTQAIAHQDDLDSTKSLITPRPKSPELVWHDAFSNQIQPPPTVGLPPPAMSLPSTPPTPVLHTSSPFINTPPDSVQSVNTTPLKPQSEDLTNQTAVLPEAPPPVQSVQQGLFRKKKKKHKDKDKRRPHGSRNVPGHPSVAAGRPTRPPGSVAGRPTRPPGSVAGRPTRPPVSVVGRPTRPPGSVPCPPSQPVEEPNKHNLGTPQGNDVELDERRLPIKIKLRKSETESSPSIKPPNQLSALTSGEVGNTEVSRTTASNVGDSTVTEEYRSELHPPDSPHSDAMSDDSPKLTGNISRDQVNANELRDSSPKSCNEPQSQKAEANNDEPAAVLPRPKSLVDRLSMLSQVLGVAPSDRQLEELPVDTSMFKRDRFGRQIRKSKTVAAKRPSMKQRQATASAKTKESKAVQPPAQSRPERSKRLPTRLLDGETQRQSRSRAVPEAPSQNSTRSNTPTAEVVKDSVAGGRRMLRRNRAPCNEAVPERPQSAASTASPSVTSSKSVVQSDKMVEYVTTSFDARVKHVRDKLSNIIPSDETLIFKPTKSNVLSNPVRLTSHSTTTAGKKPLTSSNYYTDVKGGTGGQAYSQTDPPRKSFRRVEVSKATEMAEKSKVILEDSKSTRGERVLRQKKMQDIKSASVAKVTHIQKESRRLILRSKMMHREKPPKSDITAYPSSPRGARPTRDLVLRSAHLPSTNDGRVTLTLRRSVLQQPVLQQDEDAKSDTLSVSSKTSKPRTKIEGSKTIERLRSFEAVYSFEADSYARKISLKHAVTLQPSTDIPLTMPPPRPPRKERTGGFKELLPDTSSSAVQTRHPTHQAAISTANRTSAQTTEITASKVTTTQIVAKSTSSDIAATEPRRKVRGPVMRTKFAQGEIVMPSGPVNAMALAPKPAASTSVTYQAISKQTPIPSTMIMTSSSNQMLITTKPASIAPKPVSSNIAPRPIPSTAIPINITQTPQGTLTSGPLTTATAVIANNQVMIIIPAQTVQTTTNNTSTAATALPQAQVVTLPVQTQAPVTFLKPPVPPEPVRKDPEPEPQDKTISHGFQMPQDGRPKSFNRWAYSGSRVDVKALLSSANKPSVPPLTSVCSQPKGTIQPVEKAGMLKNCMVRIAPLQLAEDESQEENDVAPVVTRTAKLRKMRSGRNIQGIIEDHDLMLKRFLAMPEVAELPNKKQCFALSQFSDHNSDNYCAYANNDWQLAYDDALVTGAMFSDSGYSHRDALKIMCDLGDSSYVSDDSQSGSELTASPLKDHLSACSCVDCSVDRHLTSKGQTLLSQGLVDPISVDKVIHTNGLSEWDKMYSSWRVDGVGSGLALRRSSRIPVDIPQVGSSPEELTHSISPLTDDQLLEDLDVSDNEVFDAKTPSVSSGEMETDDHDNTGISTDETNLEDEKLRKDIRDVTGDHESDNAMPSRQTTSDQTNTLSTESSKRRYCSTDDPVRTAQVKLIDISPLLSGLHVMDTNTVPVAMIERALSSDLDGNSSSTNAESGVLLTTDPEPKSSGPGLTLHMGESSDVHEELISVNDVPRVDIQNSHIELYQLEKLGTSGETIASLLCEVETPEQSEDQDGDKSGISEEGVDHFERDQEMDQELEVNTPCTSNIDGDMETKQTTSPPTLPNSTDQPGPTSAKTHIKQYTMEVSEIFEQFATVEPFIIPSVSPSVSKTVGNQIDVSNSQPSTTEQTIVLDAINTIIDNVEKQNAEKAINLLEPLTVDEITVPMEGCDESEQILEENPVVTDENLEVELGAFGNKELNFARIEEVDALEVLPSELYEDEDVPHNVTKAAQSISEYSIDESNLSEKSVSHANGLVIDTSQFAASELTPVLVSSSKKTKTSAETHDDLTLLTNRSDLITEEDILQQLNVETLVNPVKEGQAVLDLRSPSPPLREVSQAGQCLKYAVNDTDIIHFYHCKNLCSVSRCTILAKNVSWKGIGLAEEAPETLVLLGPPAPMMNRQPFGNDEGPVDLSVRTTKIRAIIFDGPSGATKRRTSDPDGPVDLSLKRSKTGEREGEIITPINMTEHFSVLTPPPPPPLYQTGSGSHHHMDRFQATNGDHMALRRESQTDGHDDSDSDDLDNDNSTGGDNVKGNTSAKTKTNKQFDFEWPDETDFLPLIRTDSKSKNRLINEKSSSPNGSVQNFLAYPSDSTDNYLPRDFSNATASLNNSNNNRTATHQTPADRAPTAKTSTTMAPSAKPSTDRAPAAKPSTDRAPSTKSSTARAPADGDSDDSDATCFSGASDWLMDDSNLEEVDIVYGTPPEPEVTQSISRNNTLTETTAEKTTNSINNNQPATPIPPSVDLPETIPASSTHIEHAKLDQPLYTSVKRHKPTDNAQELPNANPQQQASKRYTFNNAPPSRTSVESSSVELGLSLVDNIYPFFSNRLDCQRARHDPMSKQCNKKFADQCPEHLSSVILRLPEDLPPQNSNRVNRYEPLKPPPSKASVEKWVQRRADIDAAAAKQKDENTVKSSAEAYIPDLPAIPDPGTPLRTPTSVHDGVEGMNEEEMDVIVPDSPVTADELTVIPATPPTPTENYTQLRPTSTASSVHSRSSTSQNSRTPSRRHHDLFSTQIIHSLNESERSRTPSTQRSSRRSSAFGDRPADDRTLLADQSLLNVTQLGDVSSYSPLTQSQYPEQSVNLTRVWSHDKSNIEGLSGIDKAAETHKLLKDMASHNTAYNDIITMSIELHINTRDPARDEVQAIFIHVHHDTAASATHHYVLLSDTGQQVPSLCNTIPAVKVIQGTDEKSLLEHLVTVVKRHDPDLLVGWEVHNLSWGYLLRRARSLQLNLSNDLSRIPQPPRLNQSSQEETIHNSEFARVGGRVLVNMWKVMRHQMHLSLIPSLTNYNFENVVYHTLNLRVPKFTYHHLTQLYNNPKLRTHVLEYYLRRVRLLHNMEQQIDFNGQTSEFARVYGIEFCDVVAKGSQYKVESMMLRIAKPLNFVAVSPNIQQRVRMYPPECIPLTLEPDSQFYSDPVIVLDFQSLYPSIMIAHNYCFSTCLGNVAELERAGGEDFKFGCTSLRIPAHVLCKLKDHINISPNGVAFVKQHVRKGVISRMVEEILDTRLMVKRCMSRYKSDKGLHKLLHARQLGLKLIANVTFGYAAANFSGRMPCVEVGDSIVRKARETLEAAIKLVNESEKWKCRVVYGDTDSLFVLVPGRDLQEAFKIGEDIRDTVSNANPKPMKLKLEKVYMGCVLQTKKRYAGYMYETADQKEPVFEAKGIETVRRDSIPAVTKMLEKSLTMLFATRDISNIKSYIQKQITKILEGSASIQDFLFSKEYRGEKGYKPTAKVPALIIAKRRLAVDIWSEPQSGERVPYVIVCGAPGTPLYQLVREPQELLANPQLKLNTVYYVSRIILPPLHRAFSLLGVNVQSWYDELPKIDKITNENTTSKVKSTLPQYFSSAKCMICEGGSQATVCHRCLTRDPQATVVALNSIVGRQLQQEQCILQICKACSKQSGQGIDDIPCISLDCPISYKKGQLSNQQTLAVSVCDKYLGKINNY